MVFFLVIYCIKYLWWFTIAIREEYFYVRVAERATRRARIQMTRVRVSVRSLFWCWLGVWVCSGYFCIDSVDRALRVRVGGSISRGLLGIVVISIVALEKGVTASAFSGPRVHI